MTFRQMLTGFIVVGMFFVGIGASPYLKKNDIKVIDYRGSYKYVHSERQIYFQIHIIEEDDDNQT